MRSPTRTKIGYANVTPNVTTTATMWTARMNLPERDRGDEHRGAQNVGWYSPNTSRIAAHTSPIEQRSFNA